jgi:hypothetical protein
MPEPFEPGDASTFAASAASAREHGVFTLATDWDDREAFEAFLNTALPGQLQEAAKAVGPSKPRVGRWIALNNDCPKAVAELYRDIVTWLTARGLPD